jgi:hypothetical protein
MRANSGLWESTPTKAAPRDFADRHLLRPSRAARPPYAASGDGHIERRRVHVAGHEGHPCRGRAALAIVTDSHNPGWRVWELLQNPGESRAGVSVSLLGLPREVPGCKAHRNRTRVRFPPPPQVGANLRFPAGLFVRERSTGRRQDRAPNALGRTRAVSAGRRPAVAGRRWLARASMATEPVLLDL